jgi:prepilin-type N-terminal cleavage/methylation domain-containing protein
MMVRRQKAFTLIELMIVVAIIAIIAAIAIPSLISSRIASYETAASSTLRSLAAAQATFVARVIVDQDADGTGEYGLFQELAGVAVPRTRAQALNAGEVFSSAMGQTNAEGVAVKSGYSFLIFLPTSSAGGTMSDAAMTSTSDPTAAEIADLPGINLQERRWVAYAWPQDYGGTGYRCFGVNQQAEVYQARNEDATGAPYYEGDNSTDGTLPGANAAYPAATVGVGGSFEAPGTAAADTQVWSLASRG